MSAIEIRHTATDELVHSIDTTGKSDKDIDRIASGMSINLNWAELHIVQVKEMKSALVRRGGVRHGVLDYPHTLCGLFAYQEVLEGGEIRCKRCLKIADEMSVPR